MSPDKNPERTRARSARRTALRLLRPHRTGTAVLCAAVLALAGAALGAVLLGRALAPDHPAVRTADALAAGPADQDTAALVLAVAAACALAAGTALVLSALLRGGRGPLALRTGDPSLVLGITRGGAARLLAERAREVDGVSGARVRLGRRRVRVLVSTRLRGASGTLRTGVEESVRRRCEELGVLSRLKVRARVREVGPA